jgi:transposase
MARDTSESTEEQWEKIAPVLPASQAAPWGGPTPLPNRPCCAGILWILRTGARWKDLPKRAPSPRTCWRRLREWAEQDVWLKAWRACLSQLDAHGQLDWAEAFADGSFAPAKTGGLRRHNQAGHRPAGDGGGRRRRDSCGNLLDAAAPAEVTLLEPRLETSAVPRQGRGRLRRRPARLIYDKAGDADALRKRLATQGIALSCPQRTNRKRPPRPDGRQLRRYKRRWKVERTCAWCGNFRRLVVRWERHITMYRAFFHVACLLIMSSGYETASNTHIRFILVVRRQANGLERHELLIPDISY